MKLRYEKVKKVISAKFFCKLENIAETDRFHHLFVEEYNLGISLEWCGRHMCFQHFHTLGNAVSKKEAYKAIAKIPEDANIMGIGSNNGYQNRAWRYRIFGDGREVRLLDLSYSEESCRPHLKFCPVVTLNMIDDAIKEIKLNISSRESITLWGDLFNLAAFKEISFFIISDEYVVFERENFFDVCYERFPEGIFDLFEKVFRHKSLDIEYLATEVEKL